MGPISTSVIIASAGLLTMASNGTITIFVTWRGFISPFRWSRIWPAIQSAGDSDFHQTDMMQVGRVRLNVAPDGSPVFTRDIGSREIYALSVRWP